MSRALLTAVSGLRAHQQQLDVVANNLANMNTIGFKSQMTTFNDVMYDTIRSGSGPSQNGGGTNPQQIGTGVEIGQISRRFSQGALQATGELLDFAIQGEGFFVLNGPSNERVYSRAGSFTLDSGGNLVDPSTGFLVQRTTDLGESSDNGFGFQTEGDNRINIPLGASIPGEKTTAVEFFGNLPTAAEPPRAEVLTSAQPFLTDTGPATLATLLNDLNTNKADYAAGDEIEFTGTNPDGTPFSTTIPAENATMQDVVDAINGVMVGATADLNPNGSLEITADETGEAFASLIIQDASGNVGGTEWARHSLVVSMEGSGGDTFDVSVEVFDKRGNVHRVEFEFRKTSVNGWELTASLNDGSGTFLDDQVVNILYNEDGTYSVAGGDGIGDTDIEIKFDDIEAPQLIDLSFSKMTHMATDYSLSVSQDGAPPGNLVTIAVSGTGEVSGLASNGNVFPLAQLAIARFANNGGLDALGQNFFQESINSGAASIGSGLTGGRGQIIGNQLETSNVDIAQEFTRLIVAQRGFSSNARTITVADEVLEELTNIVR